MQILTNSFWTPLKTVERKSRVANSTRSRLDEFIDGRMIYSIELNRGYLKLVLIITKHESLHDVQPPMSWGDVTKSVVKKLASFALRHALGGGSKLLAEFLLIFYLIFLLFLLFSSSLEAKHASFVEDTQERKCTLKESKERERVKFKPSFQS